MSSQRPWNEPLDETRLEEHIVQLYREERFVVEAIAIFAGQGLGKGGAVILVATPSHLEAVEESLADVGISVEELKRTGQLTSLDAATVLARFMVDGMPAPELFRAVVADMVKTARADGRYPNIRLYGEMAHLLWKESLPAALRLEQLWSEAIEVHSMALFCTYLLDGHTHVQEAFPHELELIALARDSTRALGLA